MLSLLSISLILFLTYKTINCISNDWVHKKVSKFDLNDEYYENKVFNNTNEVIEDARHLINNLMQNKTIPGFIIGFSIKGKDVWTESFGLTDIENNVKTDKDSVWRLASISKPLTSALVGKLLDKGLLNLNKSIYDYLPENLMPIKEWDGLPVNITLRQVLSHTAGFQASNGKEFLHLFEAQNVSQTLKVLKNENLLFKPGTKYTYSNYGFQVVGAIIESVLNNTFPNEIQKMCLGLGMNSTFAEKRETIIKHRPRYYWENLGKLINAYITDDLFSYEGWWPSGGMVSTVSDLLKFGNAMLSSFKGNNKSFISQETVKQLWTPETPIMNGSEYAKGWVITHIAESVDYPYKTIIWHNGGLTGTSTLLHIYPDQDIVGVAFANKGFVQNIEELILLNIAHNFKPFL